MQGGVTPIKRFTVLFIVMVMLFSASCVFASEEDQGVRIFFDGEEVSFRVAPRFYNNRLVVPVRPFLEALGAPIGWDHERGAVSTAWEGENIVLFINQAMIEINGEVMEVDTPAVVVAGATMIPLRLVSELFGLQVNWDGEAGVVEVESKNSVPFQKVKEVYDLPAEVIQWVNIFKSENVNAMLEFDSRLYILSALGWKSSGGYDVQIKRITQEDTAWRVNVEMREPLPGQASIQVISYPYDLVYLDLTAVGRPSAVVFRTINAKR